jgi:hypothetical protein
VARSKKQVIATAMYHGHSREGASHIADIVAPAEASAESSARGLRAGDYVVCRVYHSHDSRRIGYVGADGMMSFGGCILSGAMITHLSQPYRFSRSPDWQKVTWDGEDICTLADGTEFRLRNDDGYLSWVDVQGHVVDIAQEATRRTPGNK